MASKVLYPPVVSDYQAAFIATDIDSAGTDNGGCKVYFTLSKFNSSKDFINAQVTVKAQKTGVSVVKKIGNNLTGIILNKEYQYDETSGRYYVTITNDEIRNGWTVGTIYKIQIRLSSVEYNSTDNTSAAQYTWLNNNASSFSEWSTVSITKCTTNPKITVKAFHDYNSLTSITDKNKIENIYISSLSFVGAYNSDSPEDIVDGEVIDTTEFLYSYELILEDSDGNIIESSPTLYAERNILNQSLVYNFKTNPENGKVYKIVLNILTNNYYAKTYTFNVTYISSMLNTSAEIAVLTIDGTYVEQFNDDLDETSAPLSYEPREQAHTTTTDPVKYYKTIMEQYTSLDKEEEEGYICLKLRYARNAAAVTNVNIIVQRSSSKDGFSTWEDFKIIPYSGVSGTFLNDLPLIYDYTIENGVIYRYAVQTQDALGRRSTRYIAGMAEAVRYFQFSYILGEDGQQLKLKFDNTLTSYKTNFLDQKTDTLGGKYPTFARNGMSQYRTLAIGGLVSFNMDDNSIFTEKKDLYYTDLLTKHEEYNTSHGVDSVYDYNYERLFREAVMSFLQNGKPKLYKSPTEGNIIVRLMDISFTPNQQLGKLVYSFTANAHEYDDFSFDNCIEYNFHTVGTASDSFKVTSYKVGQLRLLPMKTTSSTEEVGGIGTVTSGTDLVPLMYNNYDYYGKNIAGSLYTVNSIRGLRIQVFNDRQSLGESNYQIGYTLTYNGGAPIYVINNEGVYYFDELVEITESDSLIIKSLDGTNMKVMLDFIYQLTTDTFPSKEMDITSWTKIIGQYAEFTTPTTSIYKKIYEKYHYDTDTEFRYLFRIGGISIEAEPGTIFQLNGEQGGKIVINETGIYNFYNVEDMDITELTLVQTAEGYTRNEIDFGTNVIVNYYAEISAGSYKS